MILSPAPSDPLLPPLQLFLELTTRCNLRCRHCYIRAGEGEARDLPASDVQGLLGEFQAMGGEFVSFSGGEPTLYGEWRPVMRYARYLGLEAMLVTNGVALSEGDIGFLDEIGASIAVSLDGASAAVHDAIRGRGSFERTGRTLERLGAAGLGGRVTLCFTPSAANCADLPGVVRLAADLGLGTVYVSLLEQRGRAGDVIDQLSLGPAERRALIFAMASLQERYPEIALECLNLRYFTERLRGYAISGDSLDRTLRVTAEGALVLTAYLDDAPFQLGPYAPGTLDRLWWGDKVRAAFAAADQRAQTVAECQECIAWPWCQGGSAAFAWTAHGRFDAVDGFCAAKRDVLREMAGGW
ncbi:radical SAM protein [Rhodospirillum rubrum]|uniref:Radical SAM n=1 Tax=Rhodospirillum rubrum (strain ATCC 11170 / ATH 1.1.1 / DSM 467 / LMG 4362 / NCIMB 8255 / S1) TaxID=269796 RepID=Q2RWC8_RHORT|nr:radical SAM protein [Rhodospirillum rubrum]ABC21567.1 Radical SAM [Rhodospirillum rubrum ATCC 11170]AEO47252.1 radical SAM family protein [Rhodospirillum rubrum F11]MBK5953186.1 radical SAM protein [Rhodospirillum rubrum]QXG81236.1 radical SAM protein [Rhodospirillum rubrum]HCF17825.1 radical SAM protein [Rhodospirillum rubrum]